MMVFLLDGRTIEVKNEPLFIVDNENHTFCIEEVVVSEHYSIS